MALVDWTWWSEVAKGGYADRVLVLGLVLAP